MLAMEGVMKLFHIPGMRAQFWNSYRNIGWTGEDRGRGVQASEGKAQIGSSPLEPYLADPELVQFPGSWVPQGISYFDGLFLKPPTIQEVNMAQIRDCLLIITFSPNFLVGIRNI